MATLTGSLQMHGLDDLDKALRDLGDRASDIVLTEALQAAGEVIRRAAADSIDSRSGRTAADIRVEVQVEAPRDRGVAAVGGTRRGRDGRAHVLRWLELGTGPHTIEAGAQDRRDVRRAVRALRSSGNRSAATALRRRIREGGVRVRRALKMRTGGGEIFRAVVKHPGIQPESPLLRALFQHGERALTVFRDVAWARIASFAKRRAA